MPTPKIKHDWYESEVYVTVIILAKNTENIKVVYNDKTVSIEKY
jgi:suppressor of G2 allele of SKP1